MAESEDAVGYDTGPGALVDYVKKSSCHQFAIADLDANVPRLLRKVADAIAELGRVEILDMAFRIEPEGNSFSATMSVYLIFDDEEF